MSHTNETHEVIILKMYGGKPGIAENEQGSEIARLEVSTYKWAPENAIKAWVRRDHPTPGRYAAVDPVGNNYGQGRKAMMNIFTISYPEFVVSCNGNDEIVGSRTPEGNE